VTARVVLMVCASVISLVDIAQVFVLGKGLGALGGFVIYGAVAIGARSGARWPAVVAMLVPIIPVTVLSGLAGQELRASLVDRPMIAVFCVQIAAFVAGAVLLSQRRAHEGSAVR
jgi:hypothetical protein